jgi:hypothetical protein
MVCRLRRRNGLRHVPQPGVKQLADSRFRPSTTSAAGLTGRAFSMAQRAHCALAEIAPDAPRLAQLLVHNPQALYRF